MALTVEQFMATPDLTVQIGDQTIVAKKKTSKNSGSLGYATVGKVIVMIDGNPTLCQMTGNITVIGSKGTAPVEVPANVATAAKKGKAEA